MSNEASFTVSGYVATQPARRFTKSGDYMLTMRIGWTPRLFDRAAGEWKDQPSSFASVICFRKVAENAATCLRRGDPIVVKGTLRVREYEGKSGVRRTAVDVIAESIGHDLAKGVSSFTKSRPHTGMTAVELEDAERAAGRVPLLDEDLDVEPDDEMADEMAENAEPLAEEDLDAMADAAEPIAARV
jgi:single-strand DNA-binding protein